VNDVIVVAPGKTSTLTLRYALSAIFRTVDSLCCATASQRDSVCRWTPTGEGKINERFDLKWQGKNKLQVKMIGTGVVPTEEKAKGKGRGRGKGKGKGKVKPLSTRFQQQQPLRTTTVDPGPRPAATNTVNAKPQGGE